MKKNITLFVLVICCIKLYSQDTLIITNNIKLTGNGDIQLVYTGGTIANNGQVALNTGTLQLKGATTYTGTGTAAFNNFICNNTGTTTVNNTIDVHNNATLSQGTLLTNNLLTLRTDVNTDAYTVDNGVLTGLINGLLTKATVIIGTTPYNSTLSVNLSGSPVQYQWQSSSDNNIYNDVMTATNPIYNATVNASIFYRCKLTTSNSAYLQYTQPVQLVYNSVLPVTLNSFNAVAQSFNAKLNWNIDHPLSYSHFTVEKSMDAVTFIPVANINISQNKAYSYVDVNALTAGSYVYYRIKLNNANGSFIYSDIKAVRHIEMSNILHAYPNPFKNTITLQFIPNASQPIKVWLTDMNGKTILEKIISSNNLTINNLSHLAKGLYILRVMNGVTDVKLKVMKQ